MNCKETQEVIHGYLDGELDVVHNLAIEQHLQECAACARSFQGQQSLRKMMARGSLYFDAPQGLEKRLRSSVRQANKAESSSWSWRWDWTRMLPPLAATAVVLLIAMPLVMRTSAEDRLTLEIVSSHVRSLMASHLTDVASTDQHTVKPWFNGKLPFSPPVTDLATQGFPLIGGRLDYVENHPVAALVYQHRKHFINVFIWPAARVANTAEELRTHQGYHSLHWSQDGMQFWAVSDVNRGDLKNFAKLLRNGSSPPSPP